MGKIVIGFTLPTILLLIGCTKSETFPSASDAYSEAQQCRGDVDALKKRIDEIELKNINQDLEITELKKDFSRLKLEISLSR